MKKEVSIKSPRHNAYGKCSCCGHPIQYKSEGKAGSFYTTRERVYLLQKCEDGFVVRAFQAWRYYIKGKYIEATTHWSEDRRVIYDNSMYGDAYWYGLYKNMYSRWIKSYSNCISSSYGYVGKVYKRTIPSLKTILCRTGLTQMIQQVNKVDPEAYLYQLRYKSYLEQLAKSNLTQLAADVAFGNTNLDIKTIVDLGKALKIDKQRLKRLRQNNGGGCFLEWLRFEKNHNKCIKDDVISWFDKEKIFPDRISFIADRMSEIQVRNYLVRQMADSGRTRKELLSTWKDYLSMAKRLKFNTNDAIVYRAKKLVQRHNELVALVEDKELAIRAGEILEKFSDVDNVCADIKAKYEYENDTYAIIAPNGVEDILAEGQALHHCIDKTERYFERINTRESFLMFLRKKDDIEKPYYTLEIEPGARYGKSERNMTDKMQISKMRKKFLKVWQKKIQERITEDDMLLAKESKNMRLREFEEMRIKNVLISHGHLAGNPLADVLEADLMEIPDNKKYKRKGGSVNENQRKQQ